MREAPPRSAMRDELVTALALGAATGIRSTSALAMLGLMPRSGAWGLVGSRVVRSAAALAFAGEVLADKLLPLPARTEPLPLAGRALLGAVGAAAAATPFGRGRLASALVGSVTAVATAWVATSSRAAATRRGVPDVVPAVVEDVVVLGLAALAAREMARASRPR